MKYFFILAAIVSFSIMGCAPDDNTEGPEDITYADSGAYGANLLDIYNDSLTGNDFSFSAKIPDEGTLKIILQKSGSGSWLPVNGTNVYWDISAYNSSTGSQTFTASGDELSTDLNIEIYPGKYTIFYYENGDTNPTREREIEI